MHSHTGRAVGAIVATLLVVAGCSDRNDSAERNGRSASRVAPERTGEPEHPSAAAVKRWNALSVNVPKQLERLASRIDLQARKALTQAERESVVTASAALADLRSQWLQAGSSFGSGQAVDAVKKAEEVERRAREVLARLGSDS